MIYIYSITNIKNNKKYIGQSINAHRRFEDHIRASKNKNDKNWHLPLYRDIRFYGEENFELKVEDMAEDREEAYRLENEHIISNDTLRNGYNTNVSYHGEKAKEIMDSDRERKYGISKKILEEDLEKHNFTELGEKYGVSDNTIRNWCNRYGIPIKSAHLNSEKSRKEFSKRMKKIAKKSSTTNKAIAMLDKETEEVLIVFESIGSATEYVGGSRSNITKSIRGKEGRRSAYGYKWRYMR